MSDPIFERYKEALKAGHVAVLRGRLEEALGHYETATQIADDRALLMSDPESRLPLRQAGLLTRDPRMKERKKYGLKRARKAPQYTKR